jgi:integrase
MALKRRGCIYHYHFWVDGRRYRGSTKQKTLAAARRVEARLIAEAEREGDLVLRKRTPVLEDFATEFLDWVENGNLKPRTKLYYQNGWRLLAETKLAGMRLNAIATDDAEGIRFPGGASNHNNAMRTLRRILGKAVAAKMLKAAPKIKLLAENQRKHVIDGTTEAKLLPFCRPHAREVLMIMRDSGMRNHKEVFTMRWEHIDWTKSRYFVYDSKTVNGRRWVPLSPRVVRALRTRYSRKKAGWVFPSKRAKCGHLTSIAKGFQSARKKAGLPKEIVPYCARHGFGTEMYRATKNLVAVMTVMGHADISTTMKYQHQDTDEIAAVANQRIQ